MYDPRNLSSSQMKKAGLIGDIIISDDVIELTKYRNDLYQMVTPRWGDSLLHLSINKHSFHCFEFLLTISNITIDEYIKRISLMPISIQVDLNKNINLYNRILKIKKIKQNVRR